MPKILICGLNNSINFNRSKNKPIISKQNTIIPKTNNVLKVVSISLFTH
ncbi:hypothetical protein HY797_02480 [Candidatus Falkowbacteria bacterium]|nr:hypothetical protein [Candidatus Falkowbacteria bacterium]